MRHGIRTTLRPFYRSPIVPIRDRLVNGPPFSDEPAHACKPQWYVTVAAFPLGKHPD